MSRLTQALAYIYADSKELNEDYIKFNLTSISINEDLKEARKKRIQNDRKTKKTTKIYLK